MMTGEEAVAFVKHLLFEEGDSTGLASDDLLLSTLDAANKKVFYLAADHGAYLVASNEPEVIYPASDASYRLADLDPSEAGPYSIVRVDLRDGDRWTRLDEVPNQDISLYENIPYPSATAPYVYSRDGRYLYLLPKPDVDQQLRIAYVRTIENLTMESYLLDQVGILDPYHHLVCYEAAITLAVKDEARIADLKLLRDELRDSMIRHFAKRRRSIRFIPYS